MSSALPLFQKRRGRFGYVAPKPPPAKEISLHMTVAGLLRRFASKSWQWTHFPAGELRDVRTAAKLKAMGLQPGWPDIIAINPSGKAHFLELKRRGETLDADQEAFAAWCLAHGVPHAVAWTLDQAVGMLEDWGVWRADFSRLAAGLPLPGGGE